MEGFLVSFNAIFPLTVAMALGYALRRLGVLNEDGVKLLNKLSFRVFLPVYLFDNLYKTDLSAAFNGRLIAFAASAVVILTALLMGTVPLIEKDGPKRGVTVQAVFRSNFALFGLPVALTLAGQDKVGPTSLLVGLIVPVYNVLAVVVLEFYRGGRPEAKKILLGIVKNPLIIASVLGVLVYFSGIAFPAAVEKSVTDLGKVATPLSLVALGGDFTFGGLKVYRKQLSVIVLGKLVISPLLIVGAGVLCGFRAETLIPLLIMSGAPTAVSSYPMAEQMGGDGKLAAEAVVVTSALSLLTMFFWIWILKQTALI